MYIQYFSHFCASSAVVSVTPPVTTATSAGSKYLGISSCIQAGAKRGGGERSGGERRGGERERGGVALQRKNGTVQRGKKKTATVISNLVLCYCVPVHSSVYASPTVEPRNRHIVINPPSTAHNHTTREPRDSHTEQYDKRKRCLVCVTAKLNNPKLNLKPKAKPMSRQGPNAKANAKAKPKQKQSKRRRQKQSRSHNKKEQNKKEKERSI